MSSGNHKRDFSDSKKLQKSLVFFLFCYIIILKYDEYFRKEFKSYHDSLINDINNLSSKSEICNMLNTEWMNHRETYDNYLWWFGSDYPQDYTKVHPFVDKKWHEEFHYQWEYDLRLYHNARYEAGTLQIIDCLRKKYGCGDVAVMPDPE